MGRREFSAFADSEAAVSMAEISRRADVGMATLYRNFPGRRELLEALFSDDVDVVCAAARTVDGDTPGAQLTAWLHRFFAFATIDGDTRYVEPILQTALDGPRPREGFRHPTAQ
ncbi:MAG: helix-turn-helix domain-containing protein [Streptosporangiaceae bacterium]